jgi:hypothetical protein
MISEATSTVSAKKKKAPRQGAFILIISHTADHGFSIQEA